MQQRSESRIDEELFDVISGFDAERGGEMSFRGPSGAATGSLDQARAAVADASHAILRPCSRTSTPSRELTKPSKASSAIATSGVRRTVSSS